jgi:hypothetical protein
MAVIINAPLVLGVVLTGSRTAMAMIPIVIAAEAALIRPWLKIGWRNLAIASVLLPALLIGTYFALPEAAPVRSAIDRFELALICARKFGQIIVILPIFTSQWAQGWGHSFLYLWRTNDWKY